MTTEAPMQPVTVNGASSGASVRVQRLVRPSLLDVFCGRGGWTKAFQKRGWWCVGVDLCEQTSAEQLEYPGVLMKCNALDLTESFINSFDAVASSPPCEEYARAWLPWLRGDKTPADWALELLEWSVKMCNARPSRITECSRFAARHVPGATMHESYALWGDVPLLMPQLPRGKMAKSGMRPDLRAEIPPALADWIADNYTRQYEAKQTRVA
jgi:hypothetical protein